VNVAQHTFWGQKRGNQYYITLPKLHLKYSVFTVGLVLRGFIPTSETVVLKH